MRLLKTTAAGFVLLTVLAASMLLTATKGKADPPGFDQERVKKGYAINPVPLNLTGKDPNLVGLGSYLVNTSGCSGCHTNPEFADGGNPFNGQPAKLAPDTFLAGGQQFGPFVSRNITPDANGLPAGLTLDAFLRTLRTGVDSKHLHPQFGPYLQVMPWPYYRHLTDLDQRAIYAYLTAIPAVQNSNPI